MLKLVEAPLLDAKLLKVQRKERCRVIPVRYWDCDFLAVLLLVVSGSGVPLSSACFAYPPVAPGYSFACTKAVVMVCCFCVTPDTVRSWGALAVCVLCAACWPRARHLGLRVAGPADARDGWISGDTHGINCAAPQGVHDKAEVRRRGLG